MAPNDRNKPQLTGPEKAAVLLMSLGEERTAELWTALEDDEIRQGIKDFSNWPTIPQLYVKGEFVGGCDIIREMFESGELRPFMEEKGIKAEAP